jgi:predicted helicase
MQDLLHRIFLRSPANLFDEFMTECQKWYDEPAHSFVEMRTRDNKKIRGDIFEDFSVLYLKHVRKFDQVWRLQDVPTEVLEQLGLKRQDVGIDIIAEKAGKYSAVQCKYKKHTSVKKNILSWKALSTFYALCLRSGPWDKYIVMTNCEYARHEGKKSYKDLSICLRTFRKISKNDWFNMCEREAKVISDDPVKKLTPAEIRAARLAYFQTACSNPHTSEA